MAGRLCLVTGGAGFIGSHIAEALLGRGDRVRILDNLSTGTRANLVGLRRAQFIEGDLRDLAAVRRATRGVEVVFHQGALPSVARSLQDPVQTEQSNVLGTVHVLRAAQECRVPKVLYAGSSSVYGAPDRFPVREDFPLRPLSPYAASKAAGEAFCRAFSVSLEVPTVILRYFNVFGPRQDPDSPYTGVVAIFIRRLLQGKVAAIHGDGRQSRDFTYVDNVVAANLLAAERDLPGGEVINVALGGETTVNQLYQTIARILGSKGRPRHGPPRPGDVVRSVAAVQKVKRLLGFRPVVGFEEGLRRTIAWYQALGR